MGSCNTKEGTHVKEGYAAVYVQRQGMDWGLLAETNNRILMATCLATYDVEDWLFDELSYKNSSTWPGFRFHGVHSSTPIDHERVLKLLKDE